MVVLSQKKMMILGGLLSIGIVILSLLFLINRRTKEVFNPFPVNLVLTDKCAEVFLKQYQFFHFECIKITLAKGLGYSIVLASAGLKLPILINVLNSASTIGLSSSSVTLESIALVASFGSSIKKELSFSLWGETILIFIQNIILLVLIKRFSIDSKTKQMLNLVILMLISLALGIILLLPKNSADALVGVSTLIALSSRVPQIYENFKNKNTGVSSVITQLMIVVGTVVRLGTVLVEVIDLPTIFSLLLSLSLSLVILGQIFMYWETSQALLKAQQEQRAREKTE